MKKVLFLILILLTTFVSAKAEETSFDFTYTFDTFETSYYSEFPSFYSPTNQYDAIIESIYNTLIAHNVEMGSINGRSCPVIICDLFDYNIYGDTYEEFNSALDQLFPVISYEIINSHGNIFYTTSQVGIQPVKYTSGKYRLNKLAFEINTNILTNTSSIDAINRSLTEAIQDFDKKCDEIIAKSLEPGMDDAQIVLALHDALMEKVSYDDNDVFPIIDHRAYSAIVGDVSVCQGYTLAYMHLLEKIGIETKFIPSPAMAHAWNAVKLNNEWYHIDLTWDDTSNPKGSHRFFLVSDNKIQEHYSGESYHHDWEHIVDCNSTKYENGYMFNVSGFTTKFKKGYFWYTKDGKYYKSHINSTPIQISKTEFLPNISQNITLYNPYESDSLSFSFATKNSGMVQTTLKNNTDKPLVVKNIIVVYNSDNTMDRIILSEEYTVPSGTKTIDIDIKDLAKSNQHIKIFLRQDDFIYPQSNYVDIN